MVIGFLWYGPLFGKKWLAVIGRSTLTQEEKGANTRAMAKTYITSFLSALVMIFVLALVIDITRADDAASGALVGFLMWLGFSAQTTLSYFLYERDLTIKNKNKITHFAISSGYYLTTLVISGVVLALWY